MIHRTEQELRIRLLLPIDGCGAAHADGTIRLFSTHRPVNARLPVLQCDDLQTRWRNCVLRCVHSAGTTTCDGLVVESVLVEAAGMDTAAEFKLIFCADTVYGATSIG